jgi:hypothetical protein
MNAQQVIDQLPAQAKRSVLFTLVGSINASLVGAAASMASKLERDGYDFKELEPRDITTLFKGSDEQSCLTLGAWPVWDQTCASSSSS